MATKENILEQFAMFNINPSDAILQKCVELCQKYIMDEEAFVEQWFAFTTSNLKGAPPTIEYLERLERKELVHNKNQDNSIMQVDMSDAMDMDISSPPSRFPTGDNAPKTPQGHLPPVSQIINTPFQAKKDHKGVDILGSSLVNSPSVESHPNNTNRKEPLSVRFYYGVKNAKFKREGDLPLTIRPVYENCMKSNQEFMLEHLGKRLDCMDHMMEDLAQAIINTRKLYKKGIQKSNLDPDEVMLYGRVVSDSKKRIDKNRILVSQGGKFRGQFVLLDLSKLSEFSVFPGQVVVAYGLLKNATGDLATLEVKEFHAKAELALPDEPPLVSGPPFEMIIACGPFTVNTDLSFEPLHDLLKYVKQVRPHLLFLTGPFYEKNHPGILKGELRQSFDNFFMDLVDTISKETPETQTVIVSSQKDPHHFPVYPTPPYDAKAPYPNVTFMPDPCLVNVNGLVIGATTVDVIFDMGRTENHVNKTGSTDFRMPRLASHVLKQQTFYPLDPPGEKIFMDYGLMLRHGVLLCKPHVLVLPSTLRHFIKEEDDCLLINPERAVKGNSSGTFVRLEINPGNSESICNRTAAQVLKI